MTNSVSEPVTNNLSQESPRKSFVATWLFSLLLGFLGVDRFYLGKVGTGLLKLFTLGGAGIWYLIDLVLVLAGAARDKAGNGLEGYEKNRVLAWVVSGVVILFSFALSAAQGDSAPAPSESSSGSSSSESSEEPSGTSMDSGEDMPVKEEEVEETTSASNGALGLGDMGVTPDGVEVTVTGVRYDSNTPNQFVIDNVKGELAAVDLTLFNGSDEQLSVSSSSVIAYIGGLEYEASALFGESGDWFLYEDINPRLGTGMSAYFDIPPGETITSVKFMTSSFLGEELEFSVQ